MFVILYGPGQSGKSTLIETVRLVLADYAKALSSETFLLRKFGDKEERKLALLPGVRFATASETEQSGKLDENLMKLLTGEDSVAGRFLYGEQFDFLPQAKIWLRTNYRPTIRGTSNAIWRRVIPVPFGKTVPENRKDVHLRDKLRKELEGIFGWMIAGYLDYAQHGLYLSPAVEAALQEYREEQDTLKQFFDEACTLDPDWESNRKTNLADNYVYKVGREELHREFVGWCERKRLPRLTKSDFKAQLKDRWAKLIAERQLGPRGEQRWYYCGVKKAAKF